ncbi:MAG: sulfurtransferase TusB [Betaproteobacteria bacterium RIFCSPLOWO2_02_67_12]|nr:MAG: sulfurtransferase TusB [Betaproteobacteria bacterium RIFCSPLOWO2_02_67_12]OGA28793.1 MAG: sulfurtransferase TusB [Betaproteobacteria bacterium RIFCSPLOWO2_02_FULL_68_150]OGA68230.1 MAG: sulfurtransferase TusB [Betaproteobacteria bacterium RIFCSPLOWO2_12_FULL_67_28]
MLHIVNKSPYERNSLASCLGHAQKGGAVLLTEDAVYGATRGNLVEGAIRKALEELPVYALGPDLEARGMQANVIEGVQVVDFGGFVDLVAEHRTSQSWL